MLSLMHNILTKCDTSQHDYIEIPGKIYAVSTGNHMILCLNVYQMVDTYTCIYNVNEVVNQDMFISIYVDLLTCIVAILSTFLCCHPKHVSIYCQ